MREAADGAVILSASIWCDNSVCEALDTSINARSARGSLCDSHCELLAIVESW
jgi:hypothetical protein